MDKFLKLSKKMFLQWISICIFCWMLDKTNADTTPPPTKPIWNATFTDLLKRDLLMTYDKFARPSQHFNTTQIKMKLTIRHVDLDEEKSILSVHGWISMIWTDDKLKWNESDYGGLTSVHMADHEIWQPDIMLYNSATGSTMDHYGNTHCIVRNNGEVIWVPPSQFQSFCEMNFKLWPFDVQNCFLMLGSWTHNGNQIDLAVDDTGITTEILVQSHQWKVTNYTAERNTRYYSCCVEPYQDIQYNITIERRSPMYKAVVITPASVIILMTLAGFLLPAQSGEKILLNGINALVIVTFLLYFAQKLPVMAINTPLVVLFYSCSLYLIACSMVLSVFVINISRTKQTRALPWIIKNALSGCFGTVLGLKITQTKPPLPLPLRDQPFNDEHSADDHQMIQTSEKASIQQDWILFATAIDRISFIVYCLIFSIMAIVYSI